MERTSTNAKTRRSWGRRELAQGAALFVLWIVFSGRLEPFHLATGIIAAAFVVWLDRKLAPAPLTEPGVALRPNIGRIILYVPWLGWQMILSAWQVAQVILNPDKYISPRLVSFKSPQPHALARVILGNSITLTPGTLTLDIDGDRYLVHALGESSTNGLLSGEMQRKVARLFNADYPDPVMDAQETRGRSAR